MLYCWEKNFRWDLLVALFVLFCFVFFLVAVVPFISLPRLKTGEGGNYFCLHSVHKLLWPEWVNLFPSTHFTLILQAKLVVTRASHKGDGNNATNRGNSCSTDKVRINSNKRSPGIKRPALGIFIIPNSGQLSKRTQLTSNLCFFYDKNREFSRFFFWESCIKLTFLKFCAVPFSSLKRWIKY